MKSPELMPNVPFMLGLTSTILVNKDGKRPTIEITGELKTLFSHF